MPTRSLRSFLSLSICVPLRKTSIAASRSFSSVAPKIWNALPGHLSSIPTLPAFRRALKHHFFLSAYPDSRTSGGITPSERITLRDTTPPAAIAPLENAMPSSLTRSILAPTISQGQYSICGKTRGGQQCIFDYF